MLNEEKKEEVIQFLKRYIPESSKREIKEMMNQDPEEWWTIHHFTWGMSIRNALRTYGFDEKYMNIENWDDYYIQCVEDSLKWVELSISIKIILFLR